MAKKPQAQVEKPAAAAAESKPEESVDPRKVTFTDKQFVEGYAKVVQNGGGMPKLIEHLGLGKLTVDQAKNKINSRKQTLTKQGLHFPDLRSFQGNAGPRLTTEEIEQYNAMLKPPTMEEGDDEAAPADVSATQ